MSIYSNVTEKDLDNLRKLADQQKNERALKIKNRILKQTHDIKLAESLSPITNKLDKISNTAQESLPPISQKLDTINKSIKEIMDEKEIIPSDQLKDTIESLKNTNTSLKLNQNEDGNYKILDTIIKPIGNNKILVNGNTYNFSPEMYKALSRSSYTGKSMEDQNDRNII